MAYRLDEDLEFLGQCTNEELNVLVETLTKDKDGEIRFSESILGNTKYQMYKPEHSQYWDLIAEEIQLFGSNSLASVFRGALEFKFEKQGVLYKEILIDVCDKLKVNYNKKSDLATIEMNLLMKMLEDAIKEMNPEELKEIAHDLDIKTTSFTSEAVLVALQFGIKKSGFFAYKMAVIIANAIAKALMGKGLTFAGNALLTRSISIFAGPIGWLVTGVWTAIDLAGPAYRVTIPVVVQVACLRIIASNRAFENTLKEEEEEQANAN